MRDHLSMTLAARANEKKCPSCRSLKGLCVCVCVCACARVRVVPDGSLCVSCSPFSTATASAVTSCTIRADTCSVNTNQHKPRCDYPETIDPETQRRLPEAKRHFRLGPPADFFGSTTF